MKSVKCVKLQQSTIITYKLQCNVCMGHECRRITTNFLCVYFYKI